MGKLCSLAARQPQPLAWGQTILETADVKQANQKTDVHLVRERYTSSYREGAAAWTSGRSASATCEHDGAHGDAEQSASITSEAVSTGQLEEWARRYEEWRTDTIEYARELSPNLAARLEVLNEIYGIPRDIVPVSPEHGLRLGIMSEILRRIEAYMEKHD